tara:strand:+ start:650 stop:1042 length:393 start_codon:yes stop_codon:yes gene_type:complete
MAFKMKGFEPHNMYKTKKANTHKDHLALEKKGYDHNPYKKVSSFTKTTDPFGNTKKEIDPALNQDDPNYEVSWKTKQELKKKNKKSIKNKPLNERQIQNFNKIINNPNDYSKDLVKQAKYMLKFNKKFHG